MPVDRTQTIGPEKRAALLAAARSEFAASGLEGASLNRILRRAGVSKGRFYYHFVSKDDLLAALAEPLLEELAASLGPPPAPPRDADEFWQQAEDGYRRVLSFFEKDPEAAGLMRAIVRVYTRPQAPREIAALRPLAEAFLQEKVAEGQRLGAVRRDLPTPLLLRLAAAAFEASDLWLVESWDELGRRGRRRVAPLVIGVLRRIAEPPPPPPAPRVPRKRSASRKAAGRTRGRRGG